MNRQVVWKRFAVVLFLPAVVAQSLPEVAVTIKQTDGDEWQTKIAGRLKMIAGEYAQTTRVERQRCVNAKLRAEVSDGMFRRDRILLQTRRRGQVRLKALVELLHPLHVDRIGRRFGQSEGRRFREQSSRIVLTLFPDFGIEIAEDSLAIFSPTPPVIPGKAFECGQWRRQLVLPRHTSFRFSGFNSHHVRGSKVGESTKIRGTRETRARRAAGRRRDAPARFAGRQSETV